MLIYLQNSVVASLVSIFLLLETFLTVLIQSQE